MTKFSNIFQEVADLMMTMHGREGGGGLIDPAGRGNIETS
jgi:hypothetical protein